jgi:hypothetical protein
MKLLNRKLVIVLALLAVISTTVVGFVFAQEDEIADEFDQVLVYMAAGIYDPDDADYEAPDGDFWHREIMGRTETEIEEDRAAAIDFFIERFGIDPVDNDDVMFQSFMVDPRNEYRAYVVEGHDVPAEGWVVRDGGWSVAVTNPDGLALGGEFEGVQVPQGSMMVFGDYNIDTVDGEPIIIHYQSGEPIVSQDAGWIAFRCEIFHEDFGTGLAQGISASSVQEDGMMHANIRNVLTFPGLGNS